MQTRTMITMLCVAAFCTGCQFKGNQVNGRNVAGERWPFVPARVRVHPFTTFERTDDGALLLDARIELLDQAGDVTKGVGELRFELYAEAKTAQGAGGDLQLMRWEVPMTTLAQNKRHYDPITRTYSFRLKLDNPPPSKRKLRIDVQITDDVGHRMSASAEVSPPKPKTPPAEE